MKIVSDHGICHTLLMNSPEAHFPFSACVLAGGRGSRMGGVNKALVSFAGSTMLEHNILALSPLFGEVFLAARQEEPYEHLGLRVALDRSELVGSLTGVLTALVNSRSEYVFVRACDAPMVEPALVADLLDRCSGRWDVVVPVHPHGYVEPLCAVYHQRCLPFVSAQLDRGDMRIRDFYECVRVLRVPVAQLRRWDPQLRSFANANTPEELDELRALAQSAQWAGSLPADAPAGTPASAQKRPSRAEAVARMLARCARPDTETLAPRQAVGRVPVSTLLTRHSEPDAPRSALDGYALRAEDLHADAVFAVTGEIRPSLASPPAINHGEAARILTGGRLPQGADTVVAQEQAQVEERTLRVLSRVRAGQGIRPAGADFSAGMPLTRAGVPLCAAACASLELDGRTEVEVYARPRCRVLAVGNELAEPGTPPGPGQLPADNLTLACGTVAGFGGLLESCRVCPNEPETIREMLTQEGADLIITAGGTGPGDRDFLRRSAQEAGFEFLFHNVALHPGKSAFAAIRRGTVLLALPGTSSALLRLLPALALPLLRALEGHATPWDVTLPVVLGWQAKAPDHAERLEFCSLDYDGAAATAHLLRDREHRIRAEMIGARLLALIPPGGSAEGETVRAYSLSSATPPIHSPPGSALPSGLGKK